MTRPSMPEVAAMLAGRMETLAIQLVGDKPTSRSRTELRFRGKGSLSIGIAGEHRGNFYDFEAGMGGDALDLIRHLRGGSPRDAWEWALAWLGLPDDPGRPAPAQAPAQRLAPAQPKATGDLARRLWVETVPAAGTAAERYLASRGLQLPAHGVLRFHPACPRGEERLPAMVALMVDPLTGEPRGVHRTFLTADGSAKAAGLSKAMLGSAGTIRLVPDDEIGAGVGLAEGVETALSVMQLSGWRPVWAAGSAGAIRTFPVLPGVEVLTIFADADDGGVSVEAGRACAERWVAAGREVCIRPAPAGADWNDVARAVAA